MRVVMKTSYALLVTALAAQQAAATWNFYDNFKSPQYCDNECSTKQSSGYDWSDLQAGTKNFQYDDFDFSGGWSCSNSFNKRDQLSKRTFGPKVIQNSCSKTKPASFSCNKRKAGFSITEFDVSVEFDVDLELHYKMGDGSTCRQISSCSSGGSTIQNTQCGGAVSVDVYIGSHFTGSQSECQIGVHRIGFDCSPPTGYNTPTPPAYPSSSAPAKSQPVSTPKQSSPSCKGGSCSSVFSYKASTPAVSTPVTSTPVTSTPVASTPAASTPAASTPVASYPVASSPVASSPVASSPVASSPVASSPVASSPASSPVASTPAASKPSTFSPTPGPSSSCVEGYGKDCTTSIPVPSSGIPSSSAVPFSSSPVNSVPPTYKATDVPPPNYVTSTPAPPSGSSTPNSPPPSYESSSVISSCGGAYGESCGSPSVGPSSSTSVGTPLPATSSAPQPSSSSTYTQVSPPDVLPKCINTWLQIQTKCKDNTDTSCYCVDADFTKSVIDCVSAWCGTDDETRTALQYLIGICAKHVDQNPKIIGDCPSYIPLNPTTPAPTPSGGMTYPASLPSQPSGPQTGVPYTIITYGSSSLTVPQVYFSTTPDAAPGARPTQPVGLVAGSVPPQTPATTTAAPYPVASTLGTQTTAVKTGTKGAGPSPPAQFTGAAVAGLVPKGALFGAVLAFVAL